MCSSVQTRLPTHCVTPPGALMDAVRRTCRLLNCSVALSALVTAFVVHSTTAAAISPQNVPLSLSSLLDDFCKRQSYQRKHQLTSQQNPQQTHQLENQHVYQQTSQLEHRLTSQPLDQHGSPHSNLRESQLSRQQTNPQKHP